MRGTLQALTARRGFETGAAGALALLALLSGTGFAVPQERKPAASQLPAARPHTPEYERAFATLRKRLKEPAPPVTAREQSESVDWMLAANPAIHHTLVGHHVIVMATDGFAARAAQNDFVLDLDLAYEVLVHVWGVDPCARVGRRFFIWPDPGRGGGYNCNGRDLRIAVGVSDRDDADGFEHFFHELTHGFQFEHPAGHLAVNGFFEGWAEFMQAVVDDHLAPLGAPFEGRCAWYAEHFPDSARVEYLRTRLSIEEIVAYDPSAGLFMELVNTTRDERGRPDWEPLRRFLQDPIAHPRWTPWHLWPARMALDAMAAFGEENARPILAKYRFPLDFDSLAAAEAQTSAGARPDASPRSAVTGWKRIGALANPKSLGLEWDPLAAEDMAWRWRELHAQDPLPPLPAGHTEEWMASEPRPDGQIELADEHGAPAYFYLATALPESRRKPLTLYISSDDDCAVWLDGELVHWFRGARACTPDYPDVAYADASGTRGQLVVLVANQGGRAAFSMCAAEGGLLFSGFEQRIAMKPPDERAAEVAYLASRRMQQPVRSLLARAAKDRAPAVRDAARWWPDLRPKEGDWREAEDAYARGTIRGGFFGLNADTSGNQCVARSWGSDKTNWLALPLLVKQWGPQRVRIRYATPRQGSLRVRLRRGEQILFTSEPLRLNPTGSDWNTWAWQEVDTPTLERGVVQLELSEPEGDIDVDLVGITSAR